MSNIDLQTSLQNLKNSQIELAQLSPETINQVLEILAKNLVKNTDLILEKNILDLEKMDINDPKYDRLKLTSERIKDMSEGLLKLVNLKSPVNNIIEEKTLQNDLKVERRRVPIGVIGMIYEARPNVTTDAFGIAFKTQNAIALKGGSDAQETNQCVYTIIQDTLTAQDINANIVYLLPPDREATRDMMQATEFIDVIIPRGSQGLIKFVRENAKVPVIETGAGIVHTYWDESGDLDIIKKVVFSAKTRRPSVCNSLDTLIVHENNLKNLDKVLELLKTKNVVIYADEKSYEVLTQSHLLKDDLEGLIKKAEPEHFGTEFLDYKMSIKTVNNLDEALFHIQKYSSKHSESIISENPQNTVKFLNIVDAACVFHNTETGYSDGEQLELGAEIGISTQKLHARGPMALEAMTSYKWVIRGNGQTRI